MQSNADAWWRITQVSARPLGRSSRWALGEYVYGEMPAVGFDGAFLVAAILMHIILWQCLGRDEAPVETRTTCPPVIWLQTACEDTEFDIKHL